MSDCNSCVHKGDRCFCPPDKYCTAYKKEKYKAKHIFEFETDDDWIPGHKCCWIDCPFSKLIPFGRRCIYLCVNDNEESNCPFSKSKSYYR